jgi:polygalacturonase
MANSDLRRRFLGRFLSLGGASVGLASAGAMQSAPGRKDSFNVREHGAAGNGVRLDTKAIQAAIDACAQSGGGAVYFPAGTYLTGTLFLKSGVRLYLETGATLLGSKNLKDYPETVPALRSYTDTYTDKSMIYGENLQDIGIEGGGVIDGQGASFQGPYKVRPYMMRFVRCHNVAVSGVVIRNSPMWVQHYLACDDVDIRGITVHSLVNRNNDGIDIDCCQRVRISDCNISSGDDAIVLKSTSARPTTDVTITNCVLSTRCNALKMGTESNGGFENITISNCSIYDTRLAGIALEIVDGGLMDGIAISNIAMRNVECPIFIRLGNRARPFEEGGPRPGVGKMRNVLLSNVEAIGANNVGCAIAGIPGHNIENVTLDNVRLSFAGGGIRQQAEAEAPENADRYPEYKMFGVLSAYAFYCRHVRGLSLRNVRTTFLSADARPALVCDEIEGLDIEGAVFASSAEGPAIRLSQVKDAFIRGCRAAGPVRAYVRVAGDRTERVSIIGNDLSKAARPVETAPDVPSDAVFLEANRRRGA